MHLSFVFALLLSILITIFAIANSTTVMINFLFTQVPVSQALVIFISAAVGALVVLIFSLMREFKLKRNLKKKKNEIEDLKEEKEELDDKLQELDADVKLEGKLPEKNDNVD